MPRPREERQDRHAPRFQRRQLGISGSGVKEKEGTDASHSYHSEIAPLSIGIESEEAEKKREKRVAKETEGDADREKEKKEKKEYIYIYKDSLINLLKIQTESLKINK